MAYRLKNRNECPPNGFIVRIPIVDVERQFWDFGSAVSFYVNFAEANPQLGLTTSRPEAEVVVDQQNAYRVSFIAGAESYVVQVAGDMMQQAKTSPAPSTKKCCGMK
jgi:hypothetical protein